MGGSEAGEAGGGAGSGSEAGEAGCVAGAGAEAVAGVELQALDAQASPMTAIVTAAPLPVGDAVPPATDWPQQQARAAAG